VKLRPSLVAVPVAVASGAITLLAFFARDVEIIGFHLSDVLATVLQWATTLAAIALLVGVFNLAAVHVRKVSSFSAGWAYSAVLVVTFFTMLFMWLLGLGAQLAPEESARTWTDLSQNVINFAFNYIQTPVEASLAALLVVIMVLAGARLIRTRRHWSAFLFIGVSLFILISLAPIGALSFLTGLREVFFQPLAVGAARGIVLGVALGAIATGLRVIIGVDRPYGD
jgi:nitrate reductase NapE component